jgi:hypothetical protein
MGSVGWTLHRKTFQLSWRQCGVTLAHLRLGLVPLVLALALVLVLVLLVALLLVVVAVCRFVSSASVWSSDEAFIAPQ